MRIIRGQLVRVVVALMAAFGLQAAEAALHYMPEDNSLFRDSALGSVNTLFKLQTPLGQSVESGGVSLGIDGPSTFGDALSGTHDAGIPTFGSLGIADVANLRIVLKASEPLDDSLTIDRLKLSLIDPGEAGSMVIELGSPLTLKSTAVANGQAGFVFGLDADSIAQARSFMQYSSGNASAFRVALSATALDAGGKFETFMIANRAAIAPVPEPASAVLLLVGVGLVLGVARQRARPSQSPDSPIASATARTASR